jgi:hypothetical protein
MSYFVVKLEAFVIILNSFLLNFKHFILLVSGNSFCNFLKDSKRLLDDAIGLFVSAHQADTGASTFIFSVFYVIQLFHKNVLRDILYQRIQSLTISQHFIIEIITK